MFLYKKTNTTILRVLAFFVDKRFSFFFFKENLQNRTESTRLATKIPVYKRTEWTKSKLNLIESYNKLRRSPLPSSENADLASQKALTTEDDKVLDPVTRGVASEEQTKRRGGQEDEEDDPSQLTAEAERYRETRCPPSTSKIDHPTDSPNKQERERRRQRWPKLEVDLGALFVLWQKSHQVQPSKAFRSINLPPTLLPRQI